MMFADALRRVRLGEPDQPRDGDGKWTSGGGGGGKGGGETTKAPAGKVEKRAERKQAIADHKQAAASAAKEHLDKTKRERDEAEKASKALSDAEDAHEAAKEALDNAEALGDPEGSEGRGHRG